VAPRAALADTFAQRCAEVAVRAVAARGTFALAIPGGSVADAFVPALAVAPIDWQRTHLFWCDERAVPADHPDSNYGRARQLFSASGVHALPHMHPMPSDSADLDVAADAYGRVLEDHTGRPPTLDLLLVGVGEDGHICSLFPGHRALGERTRSVVAVEDAPKPPPRRLTVTMPVVERARTLCVAAFGSEKAPVMRGALDDPMADTPVARALRAARDTWVMLDDQAAP
jgi:6-phosphogluconolactonase